MRTLRRRFQIMWPVLGAVVVFTQCCFVSPFKQKYPLRLFQTASMARNDGVLSLSAAANTQIMANTLIDIIQNGTDSEKAVKKAMRMYVAQYT